MTVRSYVVAGLIATAVVAAHGGALHGGFHYDDRPAITDNLAVRSWQPLAYLTDPASQGAEPGSPGFRPVTVMTFAVNYALGRLDPFGYLLGNLLLHGLVAWMVFVVGCVLLRDKRWAAFAALAYAVHPLNAESVNYVVARSSLLSALGGVTTVWAVLRRRAGGGAGWTAFGVTAFGLALLSKESGVAALVPVAAIAMMDPTVESTRDRGAWRGRLTAAWRVSWPYVATLVVYLTGWWLLVGSHTEQRGRFAVYPAWTFLEMTARSLALWVWPWPLGIEHRLVFVSGFDGWAAAAVAGSLGGVALLGWRYRLRRPLVSWCILWALAGLLPLAPLPWATVKGLLQENRTAFSAIALAWLTAVAARELLTAVGRAAPRLVRPAAVVGASVLFVAAVAVDRGRAYVWNDDVRLWEEAVRLAPESRSAHINLGGAHLNRREFDRAETAYRRALALTPDEATPYYALGVLAFRRGRDDEAQALLLKTVDLAPEYAASYGLLGAIALRQQRDQAAAAFFLRTVELDPRHAIARANLGLLAQRARDDAVAERWYREAIALDPDQSLARNNLGTLYLNRRQWREALEQFSAVLAASPEDHDAALNHAVALDAIGRRAEARTELASLLTRLPPDERFDHHRRIAAVMVNRMPP